MFGLGFTEILLIAVVALLFIGPDKLPDTMKTIARTLGKVKRVLDDTKSTLEQELRVDDLRAEVMQYRQELEKAKSDLSSFKNVASKEVDSIKDMAKIENSYQPTNINDSQLFDDFSDKTDRDAEELEKEQEEFRNKTKNLANEAKEHLNKKNELESKAVRGFKYLDKKES